MKPAESEVALKEAMPQSSENNVKLSFGLKTNM
jgi:hypothetical protein